MFSLSARILICCSLSSPLMYKVFTFFSRRPFCKKSVLFPIPGSPATNTILPATIPPPNTLFTSGWALMIRFSSALPPSCNDTTRLSRFSPLNFFHSDSKTLFSLVITSSTNVFHCSHEGHLPSHFALSYPQLLQKNAVLILLMPQS